MSTETYKKKLFKDYPTMMKLASKITKRNDVHSRSLFHNKHGYEKGWLNQVCVRAVSASKKIYGQVNDTNATWFPYILIPSIPWLCQCFHTSDFYLNLIPEHKIFFKKGALRRESTIFSCCFSYNESWKLILIKKNMFSILRFYCTTFMKTKAKYSICLWT